jgi:SHS2 domain-containing protein
MEVKNKIRYLKNIKQEIDFLLKEKRNYKLLNHLSDTFIESYGKTMEEAFENAALALMDTMVRIEKIHLKIEDQIEVTGFDLNSLLYNWLESVLIKVTAENKVYSSFRVNILRNKGNFILNAILKGEYLEPSKHRPDVEVKAVTYHLMSIKKKSRGVVLRFLLDI